MIAAWMLVVLGITTLIVGMVRTLRDDEAAVAPVLLVVSILALAKIGPGVEMLRERAWAFRLTMAGFAGIILLVPVVAWATFGGGSLLEPYANALADALVAYLPPVVPLLLPSSRAWFRRLNASDSGQ